MTNISKIALMTDIHFGAKANSELHNQDCLNYIDWFCNIVRNDPTINAIGVLGDWNENRSALNILTLNYSYQGAKKINDLGLPVFFVLGNHDLYHRHSRAVHSVIPFNEFENFTIIDNPTLFKSSEGEDILFCPYMFPDEYPSLARFIHVPTWFGHFEFKGFEITGYGTKLQTGPDAEDFKGPRYIFSGHFHKRQMHENSNVVYIGNTFPTTFGDAGDVKRGMCTYNYTNNEIRFFDWAECPKYIKTTLSSLIDKKVALAAHARVKCEVDIPISFEESNILKQTFITEYELREFVMEESQSIAAALSYTETTLDVEDIKLSSVNDLVIQMLNDISSDHFDNELLTQIYQDIKT